VKLGELATSSNFSRQFCEPHQTGVTQGEETSFANETVTYYLHLRMVRRDAESNQAERNRQFLVHVYLGMLYFCHGSVGRVKPSRPRADHGQAERTVMERGCRVALRMPRHQSRCGPIQARYPRRHFGPTPNSGQHGWVYRYSHHERNPSIGYHGMTHATKVPFKLNLKKKKKKKKARNFKFRVSFR
jgi:hypothetical protein